MAEDLPSPEVRRGRRPGDVYVRRPRLRTRALPRVLGAASLYSAAYGNVGSSIYYALGVTALFALGLTPLVFVASGIFFGFTALTYAEGATAMPVAGGSTAFARRAFNELASFVAGWGQLLNFMVTIAISAFAVPNYLGTFWEPLGEYPGNTIFGIAVIGGLAAVNVLGVRESSVVNVGLALLDLLTQVMLVLLGIVFLLSLPTLMANVRFGEAPTWDRFFLGIAISMIAYTGIETVSNLAEETRNPGRNVPRSVLSVFGTVLVIYALLPGIALSSLPVRLVGDEYQTDLAEEFITDPVLGIVEGLPGPLQPSLEVWVGILAATILLIATNAGLLGLSRLAYSMGQHRQLPPQVSRLHPVRRTPVSAIIVFGLLSALFIIPGQVEILASLYAFGAMLSFTIAHAAIIALRAREPNLTRPFRIPLNVRLRGVDIPLTAVAGGMATAFAWLVVVVTQASGRYIGFSWLAVGLIMYLVYRRAIGAPLTKTVRVEGPGR
ncbi:MAG: APC family permease [Dehalococcoidia bacterium]